MRSRNLIKRRTDEGWQFVYLGADIDAYKTARTFRVAHDATLAYWAEETLALAAGCRTHGRRRAAGDWYDPEAAIQSDNDK